MTNILSVNPKTILIFGLILGALVVWLALPQGATFGSVASNIFPDRGNVGIGTTTPDAPLHVLGSNGSGDILVDSTHERGSLISFRKGGVQHAGVGMTGKIEGNQSEDLGFFAETGRGLRFYVNGSPYEVAVINSSGNVGIGTTDPKSRLHVIGYTQLDLTSGAPPAADCDQAQERGRMKVDNAAGLLYVCVDSGWAAK